MIYFYPIKIADIGIVLEVSRERGVKGKMLTMKYVVAVGRRDLAKGPKVQKSEVQHSAIGEAAARGKAGANPFF